MSSNNQPPPPPPTNLEGILNDDLFWNSSDWDLEKDRAILQILENLSLQLENRGEQILINLQSLETQMNQVQNETNTMSQQFRTLLDEQFVEVRVNSTTTVTTSSSPTKNSYNIMDKTNIVVVNNNNNNNQNIRNSMDEEDSDGDLIGAEFDNDSMVDPLNERPLPLIVGSDEFQHDPLFGMQQIGDDDLISPIKPMMSGISQSSNNRNKLLMGNRTSTSDSHDSSLQQQQHHHPQPPPETMFGKDDLFDSNAFNSNLFKSLEDFSLVNTTATAATTTITTTTTAAAAVPAVVAQSNQFQGNNSKIPSLSTGQQQQQSSSSSFLSAEPHVLPVLSTTNNKLQTINSGQLVNDKNEQQQQPINMNNSSTLITPLDTTSDDLFGDHAMPFAPLVVSLPPSIFESVSGGNSTNNVDSGLITIDEKLEIQQPLPPPVLLTTNNIGISTTKPTNAVPPHPPPPIPPRPARKGLFEEDDEDDEREDEQGLIWRRR
jgi:hypothetical protein